jgi:hypothetical protein
MRARQLAADPQRAALRSAVGLAAGMREVEVAPRRGNRFVEGLASDRAQRPLAKVVDLVERQTQPLRQRRHRLHGAPVRAGVDRIDALAGESIRERLGSAAPLGGERAHLAGRPRGVCVPDQEEVGHGMRVAAAERHGAAPAASMMRDSTRPSGCSCRNRAAGGSGARCMSLSWRTFRMVTTDRRSGRREQARAAHPLDVRPRRRQARSPLYQNAASRWQGLGWAARELRFAGVSQIGDWRLRIAYRTARSA